MANEVENVIKSVQDHLDTELSGSTSIDWLGVDFETDDKDHWIEPRFLGIVPRVHRRDHRHEAYLWNINCYSKPDGGNAISAFKSLELADLVRAALHQQDIAVKDWEEDPPEPELFRIRFGEIAVTPVPGSGGSAVSSVKLVQYNVSVTGFVIATVS